MELPKQYNSKECELKWEEYWEKEGIYKFDRNDTLKEIFSVDTPPPTVSGKMHIGHAFSYTQQDFIIRYQRMLGKNVFYPFGTDDNGIPTERLIEQTKNVRARDMKRDDFVNLCVKTLKEELRPKYIKDWKRIGCSCDWSIFYTTIDPHCQKISQRSFIDLYLDGREYRKEAPTMWCPECQTGISQVECQDKILDSYFNDIIFKVISKKENCNKNDINKYDTNDESVKEEDLIIATTRPELLPACVAIFYHPEDKRYTKFKGKMAKVPIFNHEVPILEDTRANPEKGTGIVMCCTFGDQTDMEWQKAHNLTIREAISANGKMTEIAGKYKGLKIKEARKNIILNLQELGILIKQEPIKHSVNVHERCGTEIEFLKSKQWFIKYLDLKDQMLEWGTKLNWFPAHMKSRYDHWVKGLQWDWLISRQRFFGVPFPVWYCNKCDETILANKEDLPVDPLRDKPPIDKCPKCGCNEFVAEKDILDTWATSSLTPQLCTELLKGTPNYNKLFPMSLRPQAHDIITFWLFNTTVKSNLHYKENPWKDVVISGHAQDPHGKKMSKSKGNIVEPQEIIEKYNADSLRFWAAGCKLGDDLPFQEKDLVTGQKMITKFWNASKFTLMHLSDFEHEKDYPLEMMDKWMLSKLQTLIKDCTDSFNVYEFSNVKKETEVFFWHTFCDDYLEIVKERLYNPEKRGTDKRISGQFTLYQSLLAILKLFAPIMPHITEEIYQLFFAQKENIKSIHISQWPKFKEQFLNHDAEYVGDLAIEIISAVRKFKSEKNISLGTNIKGISILCTEEDMLKLDDVREDILATTRAGSIKYGEGENKISDKISISVYI